MRAKSEGALPTPATHFLNVDLDLKSKADLGPLLDAMGENVVGIHSEKRRGAHRVLLELYELRYVDAERCLARFADLIRRLPTPARRLWNGALHRRFDVGIQAVSGGPTFTSALTNATLRRVGELGGELIVTVYAPPTRRVRK